MAERLNSGADALDREAAEWRLGDRLSDKAAGISVEPGRHWTILPFDATTRQTLIETGQFPPGVEPPSRIVFPHGTPPKQVQSQVDAIKNYLKAGDYQGLASAMERNRSLQEAERASQAAAPETTETEGQRRVQEAVQETQQKSGGAIQNALEWIKDFYGQNKLKMN